MGRPLSIVGRSRLLQERPLGRDLNTGEMVEAFLNARPNLSHETVWFYRSILGAFAQEFAVLPRDPAAVIEFIWSLSRLYPSRYPLATMTRRRYYEALQTFYAWVKQRREPSLDALPYEGFGRKRRRRKRRS